MKYMFYELRLFYEVLSFRKSRVVPRNVGAPGGIIIWGRLNPILLKLLRHRAELERAQTANNVQRNSFACGNLSFLAPHFGVLQRSLSAHGSCLARPPNRCNAMGKILNSHNNTQWHKIHTLYATSDYAMCTYTPLLNMRLPVRQLCEMT